MRTIVLLLMIFHKSLSAQSFGGTSHSASQHQPVQYRIPSPHPPRSRQQAQSSSQPRSQYQPPSPYQPPSSYRPPSSYQPPSPYQPPSSYQPPSPYQPPSQYPPKSQYQPFSPHNQVLSYMRPHYGNNSSRSLQLSGSSRGQSLSPLAAGLANQPHFPNRAGFPMYQPSTAASSPRINTPLRPQWSPPRGDQYQHQKSTMQPSIQPRPTHYSTNGIPPYAAYHNYGVGPAVRPFRHPPNPFLPKGGGNSFGNKANIGGNFALLLTPHHEGNDKLYRYTDNFLNNVNKGINAVLHYIRSKDDGKSSFDLLSVVETASKLGGSLGPLLQKLNLKKIFGRS